MHTALEGFRKWEGSVGARHGEVCTTAFIEKVERCLDRKNEM